MVSSLLMFAIIGCIVAKIKKGGAQGGPGGESALASGSSLGKEEGQGGGKKGKGKKKKKKGKFKSKKRLSIDKGVDGSPEKGKSGKTTKVFGEDSDGGGSGDNESRKGGGGLQPGDVLVSEESRK